MPFISWSKKMSVHNPKIDEEHKKLFNLVNALHAAIKIGNGNDVVGKILQKLIDYTRIHFTHEEEMMRLYKYPLFSHHKNEHNVLTNEVHAFYVDFLTGRKSVSLELMEFLKSWLRDHILGYDLEFAEYLIRNKLVQPEDEW